MSAARRASRGAEAGFSRGLFLAASLALIITAGICSLLLRPWSIGPASADRDARPLEARSRSGGAPPAREPRPPTSAAEAANAAGHPGAPTGGSPKDDALAALYAGLPALERTAWAEAAAELSAGASARKLPRALRSLALELGGTVRTMAGTGSGELTSPAVLVRILDELLERDGERLDPDQRSRAANLAARTNQDLDRVFAGAPSSPHLASTVAEVEVKLDLMKRLAEILGARQRAVLDRLAGGEEAPLSPLALIEARELDIGADGAAFRRSLAADVAREFDLDPPAAAALAAAYYNDLAPLLGSSPPLPASERALTAARAQVRMIEAILRTPGLTAEARERAMRARTVVVPRI